MRALPPPRKSAARLDAVSAAPKIFVLKDQVGKAAIRLSQESPSEVVCAVAEAELYHGATKYGVLDSESEGKQPRFP